MIGAVAALLMAMAVLANGFFAAGNIRDMASELPEILGMSDRIAVMRGGTVVRTIDRAEATQESILGAALENV